jgi:hypothetical protein
MVDDLDQPSRVLERDGWVLDAGTVHVGQAPATGAWPGPTTTSSCCA